MILREILPFSSVLLIILVSIFVIFLLVNMSISIINEGYINELKSVYLSILILITFILITILSLYFTKVIKIATGKFIIVEDSLKSAKKERSILDFFDEVAILFKKREYNSKPYHHYYLYFDNLYGKYGRRIEVKDTLYYNKGGHEKYYLVFVKGFKEPFIFEKTGLDLNDELNKKMVDFEYFDNFLAKKRG